MVNDILLIARKDLLVELRGKGALNTVLLLAVLVLFVVYFSVEPQHDSFTHVAPAALWISILFSGILGLNHFTRSEQKNQCLSAIVMSPFESWSLYLGKTLSTVLFLSLVELFLIPCFFLIFGFSFTLRSLFLVVVLLLGNLGIGAIGTLMSALLSFGRASEFLLPLVMIPPLIPLVMNAVHASEIVLKGDVELMAAFNFVLVLIGMNIIFLPLGILLSSVVYQQ